MPKHPPAVIGHHLIWTLYGHWLPNDPRGSGSEELEQEKFATLGPVHQGRRPEHLQPARAKLRQFQQAAKPLLSHEKFWLDTAKREALGDVFAEVVAKANYTLWACAILSNHIHLVIRRHHDDALTIWHRFADATRLRLREFPDITADHPIWADRPYKVYLNTPQRVRACNRYVERNPENEGLTAQQYDFVQPYNNWPFHKPR